MTVSDRVLSLAWPHGVAAVNALAATIGPAAFVLPDGRQISPFYIAPWLNDPEVRSEGGLMAGLRGEWPCVPFGFPLPVDGFPPDWLAVMDADEQVAEVHGFGSNHDWQFDAESNEREIVMSIAYPDGDDIERLVRTIRPDPQTAAVDFELQIHARRDCSMPISLHGCFRLPISVGEAILEPGKFDKGWTHPGTVEPGASLFAPDRKFTDLTQVPGRDGAPRNAAQLPLNEKVEELLQLNGIDGTFCLRNEAEGYRMRFTWDAEALPSVLLWYSNYGRSAAPWSSRNLCIGIEPSCSAFGLSPTTSRSHNPLRRAGTPTTVPLSAETPLTISYRVAVEPI
ncbi:MAG: hypothetical protein ACTSYE_08705 [Alphaproteobacteria bacterium]